METLLFFLVLPLTIIVSVVTVEPLSGTEIVTGSLAVTGCVTAASSIVIVMEPQTSSVASVTASSCFPTRLKVTHLLNVFTPLSFSLN